MGAGGSQNGASWQSLLGLGAVVAVAMIVGLGLGRLADVAAGSSPAFLLVGLALGLVGGVAFAVSKFKQYLKT